MELCSFYCRPSTGIQDQIIQKCRGEMGLMIQSILCPVGHFINGVTLLLHLLGKEKRSPRLYRVIATRMEDCDLREKCFGTQTTGECFHCFAGFSQTSRVYYLNCSLSNTVRSYLLRLLLSSSITSQKSTANKLILNSKQSVSL